MVVLDNLVNYSYHSHKINIKYISGEWGHFPSIKRQLHHNAYHNINKNLPSQILPWNTYLKFNLGFLFQTAEHPEYIKNLHKAPRMSKIKIRLPTQCLKGNHGIEVWQYPVNVKTLYSHVVPRNNYPNKCCPVPLYLLFLHCS